MLWVRRASRGEGDTMRIGSSVGAGMPRCFVEHVCWLLWPRADGKQDRRGRLPVWLLSAFLLVGLSVCPVRSMTTVPAP